MRRIIHDASILNVKIDKPIKDDIAMNTTMGLIRATDLNLSSGKSRLIFCRPINLCREYVRIVAQKMKPMYRALGFKLKM